MTAKCKFCNDTKQEPGVPGVCVWCDEPKANAVRRYTAVELRFATNSAGDYVSAADYDALAAKLAEQYQGEPVVEIDRAYQGYLKWTAFGVLESGRLPDGTKLYTHADAGELERMREEVRLLKLERAGRAGAVAGHEEARYEAEEERYTLRDQLAERDALPQFAQTVIRKLKRFRDCAEDGQGADIGKTWFDILVQLGLLNRVQRSPAWWEITDEGDALLDGRAALSASAEPSTQVERDEREDFEAWFKGRFPANQLYRRDALPTDDPGYNEYCNPYPRHAFEGWQARAALERKP